MEFSSGKRQRAKRVVVYGPEGIGKSTFASKFPDARFLDVEGSTDELDVLRAPKATSWTMLMDQARYFYNNPTACSTLVTDTGDWAERLCSEHICSLEKVSGIEAFGYGKGYVYLEEEFGRFLNLLFDISERGINVVVLCHAQMRKFEQPDEIGAYDRWELKLEKKTAALLKEWADMILFANYKTYVVNVDGQGAQKGKNKAQGNKRVMYTTHHQCWDAKNRSGLDEELPFDFAAIAHVIPSNGKQLVNAEAERLLAEQKQTQKPYAPTSPQSTPPAQTESKATAPDVQEVDGSTFPDFPENAALPEYLESIPRPLMDLMKRDGVTVQLLQEAVAFRGYYTIDTPVMNYEPAFVDNLVAIWPKVLDIISEVKANKAEPF